MQRGKNIGRFGAGARQAKQFAMLEGHGTRRCLDGGIGRGSLRFKRREKIVSMAFRRQTP